MTKIEKRGSAFYLITSEGTETEVHITKDGKALDLRKCPHPENRQWVMLSKFKNTDVVELTPHVDKTFAPKSEKSEKSEKSDTPAIKKDDLSEYLDEEDRLVYEALIKKAIKNKTLALAKKRVEEAQAEVDRLMAEMNENEEEGEEA